MTTYLPIANVETPYIKMDRLEVGRERGGVAWTACLTQDRICEVGGICKCSNKHSGFIKCREFLDYL
jgi:hypothetical protein